MFQDHFQQHAPRVATPTRLALAVRHAPAAHVGLVLPDFARDIPGKFSVSLSQTNRLTDAAVTLAELGVLQPKHWNGNPIESVSAAFTALAKQHLPRPLADWRLQFVDDTDKGNTDSLTWGEGCGSYDNAYVDRMKLPAGTQLGALILTHNTEALVHRAIGPAILRLEQQRAGLGQSVLYWLHNAFDGSCRALDPIHGIHWASHSHWQGEEDESQRMEEEVSWAEGEHNRKQAKLPKGERKPFDKAAAMKATNIFTKSDYDRHIPLWAGSAFKHEPQLSIAKMHPCFPDADLVGAAINAARVLQRTQTQADRLNDAPYFERCREEMSPYLIRWHCTRDRKSQDALAQLYDDAMNDVMNAGEELLDVNAVFAWHDAASLADAVNRFTIYLQRVQAADTLLAKLAPGNL